MTGWNINTLIIIFIFCCALSFPIYLGLKILSLKFGLISILISCALQLFLWTIIPIFSPKVSFDIWRDEHTIAAILFLSGLASGVLSYLSTTMHKTANTVVSKVVGMSLSALAWLTISTVNTITLLAFGISAND